MAEKAFLDFCNKRSSLLRRTVTDDEKKVLCNFLTGKAATASDTK
jgi:hypothetical protein